MTAALEPSSAFQGQYRKSLASTAAMASWYDRKYREMNGCWQTPIEELDRHLDDFGLPSKAEVLDIGCGDGSLVKRILQRGSVAVGIEISDQARNNAERGISVCIHDICTAPFGQYPHAISLGSLEHVIDIDAALDNIRLSLKPDGRWYFYVPNELWKHNDQPNERTATDAEWTALFEKHGLTVESSKRWNDSTAFQGRVRKDLTWDIGCVWCGPQRPEWPEKIPGERYFAVDNGANRKTPCQCYQDILDMSAAEILIYLHADVTIHDPQWLSRIMSLFQNENCVAVGFGGATSLGRPDLYRKPYNIWNMARGGYASNQRDAEVHGNRFTGDRRVAVLDAFCMAIRTDWLRNKGGWPVENITHHGLDLWLACEVARDDRSIFMCGVDCTHHGGGASVTPIYSNAKWLQGGSMQEDHSRPHRWLADSYRDVLPITV